MLINFGLFPLKHITNLNLELNNSKRKNSGHSFVFISFDIHGNWKVLGQMLT